MKKKKLRNQYYRNYLLFNNIKCPCRICGENIVWDNSCIRTNGEVYGRTHKSSKNVNGSTYYLSVCQDCFEKQFPGKVPHFNVMCESTKWAYDIPDDEFTKFRKKYSLTLENMVKKYGEDEGKRRWDKYCERQAETNTFDYKQKVYGWTKEQFNEYNLSRAVTLKNMIKRYGEDEGRRRWDKYCEKQSETKSWDYMVEKFGEEQARAINKKKAQACDFNGFSKVSQECFEQLSKKINHKCLYHDNGGEQLIECSSGNYLLDFYIPDLKICVEFNGSIWHADPRLYNDNEICNPFLPDLTAKEIREKDNKRYEELLKEHNIKTFVIWEMDYNTNFNVDEFIKKIMDSFILNHED